MIVGTVFGLAGALWLALDRGGMNNLVLLAGLAALAGFSAFAYLFRRTCVVIYLLLLLLDASDGPLLGLPAQWSVAAGGTPLRDLLLSGMLGAVFLFLAGRRRRGAVPWLMAATYSGLALWLLFEVSRNVGVYGLSAFGEFRAEYLMLVIPGYVFLAFQQENERAWVARALALVSAPGVLAVVLAHRVVGGVMWTPGFRFTGASWAVGLLFGLAWLLLSRRHGFRRSSGLMVGACSLLGALVLLSDAHRSVWMTSVVMVAVLLILGEIRINRIWRWGLAVVLVAVLFATVFYAAGTNPFSFLNQRAAAFWQPAQDPNSSWRLDVWRAQLEAVRNPIAGDGFGAYWNVYVPELRSSVHVAPHSLYVQTVAKTGVVGLALLGLLALLAVRVLVLAWTRTRVAGVDRALMALGLAATVSGLFYVSVYALDPFLLFWVGLGVAAAIRSLDANRFRRTPKPGPGPTIPGPPTASSP